MKLMVISLASIFISCQNILTYNAITGDYRGKGVDFVYDIGLRDDSIFTLSKEYFEVVSKCTGKVEVIKGDTLFLKCFDEQLPTQFTVGYMKNREQRIIILSKRRLKLGQVVLRRL